MTLVSEILFFRKPVDPLFVPFTNVGVVKVTFSFKVILVTVCTSYSEIFHSLISPLLVLYEPDSSLKS